MGHDVCPIRYSSGNRKIQTISTKCQYRPIISTGVYQSALKRLRAAITISVVSRPRPDNHMERVHSGHREIEEEENLRLVEIVRVCIMEIRARGCDGPPTSRDIRCT